MAQSGYGMRFTDYPPRRENGGNCYACHQLTMEEVSYGTLGPSLYNYGKIRDYEEEEIKRISLARTCPASAQTRSSPSIKSRTSSRC